MDIADAPLARGGAAGGTTLYAEHALGLVRLAVVLTGDRGAAEDIVQDAFLGLYRRWDHLADTAAPLAYLRVSVVNGCRSARRRRSRLWLGATADVAEAETARAMGVSRGTVKSATHRALAAVGRILREGS